MKILVLGTRPSRLTPILKEYGCEAIECEDLLGVDFLGENRIDFAVSYRYRYIIRKPVIEYLKGNIINLHISLLPWNRGADPNLWSFLEDSPKGGSIHYIDEGVDTGDIIAQKEVLFDISKETLATTYMKLNAEIVDLFKGQWLLVMDGKSSRYRQPSGGSVHKVKDKKRFQHLLAEKGWDTPVEALIGKALLDSERRA
jgi:methionyl-tRNA formyltransferase